MSGRKIEFLENWVKKHVTAFDHKGSHERAKELAAQYFADAAALGPAVEDFEPEWVEEIIYDAMHDDLGDESAFWKTVAAIQARRNKTLH